MLETWVDVWRLPRQKTFFFSTKNVWVWLLNIFIWSSRGSTRSLTSVFDQDVPLWPFFFQRFKTLVEKSDVCFWTRRLALTLKYFFRLEKLSRNSDVLFWPKLLTPALTYFFRGLRGLNGCLTSASNKDVIFWPSNIFFRSLRGFGRSLTPFSDHDVLPSIFFFQKFKRLEEKYDAFFWSKRLTPILKYLFSEAQEASVEIWRLFPTKASFLDPQILSASDKDVLLWPSKIFFRSTWGLRWNLMSVSDQNFLLLRFKRIH